VNRLQKLFNRLRANAQRLALPVGGEKKDRKRETAKVQEKVKKRAESQPSGAPSENEDRPLSVKKQRRNGSILQAADA
jgi:hypothetical protein